MNHRELFYLGGKYLKDGNLKKGLELYHHRIFFHPDFVDITKLFDYKKHTPPSSFTIHSRKHFRVSWKMTNDLGDPVRVKVTVPMSPSTNRWCEYHKFQVKQRFRELNITRDVDHV